MRGDCSQGCTDVRAGEIDERRWGAEVREGFPVVLIVPCILGSAGGGSMHRELYIAFHGGHNLQSGYHQERERNGRATNVMTTSELAGRGKSVAQ